MGRGLPEEDAHGRDGEHHQRPEAPPVGCGEDLAHQQGEDQERAEMNRYHCTSGDSRRIQSNELEDTGQVQPQQWWMMEIRLQLPCGPILKKVLPAGGRQTGAQVRSGHRAEPSPVVLVAVLPRARYLNGHESEEENSQNARRQAVGRSGHDAARYASL